MPNVTFTIDSVSNFTATGTGMIGMAPALAAQGRLYVIYSGTHTRPFYIGTSGNVQQRFQNRVAAMNDAGIVAATLQNSFVFTIRVTINNINHQPNDLGIANGIDVEKLLLRLYHVHYQAAFRNTAKWSTAFANTDGNGLHVRYLDPQNRVGGFAPVGANGFVQLLAGAGNY
ncbi:hypothetical protein [Jeongeupia chitinilytica]|uniref:GIY-YIG domain-containing protein n=1 Tax=Jeongeupia chitinilytica TaxID=1041641 RepID=A0ABQ3GUA5_9NEIS|nr:hypothetical protein [Jeongeupia chitinilytica]GHD55351.1 hypothetical protein GCM10007350_00890 [Jeongeupia chitinilytica]